MNILIAGFYGFARSKTDPSLKDHHSIYWLDIVSLQKDVLSDLLSKQDIERSFFLSKADGLFIPTQSNYNK